MTTSDRDDVEVTQSVRDEAADFARANGHWLTDWDAIRAGKMDDTVLVKVFAKRAALAAISPTTDCGNLGWCRAEGRCSRHGVTKPAPEDAEKLQRTLVNFVQTPDWSPNAEPPEDNADWRAGYEAAQSNLREALKPWWPLGQYLALASIGERS